MLIGSPDTFIGSASIDLHVPFEYHTQQLNNEELALQGDMPGGMSDLLRGEVHPGLH